MILRLIRSVRLCALAMGLPLAAAVGISLSPTTATVNQGATKQFTATVTGTTNTGVTWTVTGTGNGTVSTSGLYTAPIKAGTFTLTATSKADTTKKATATITVPAIAISVSPATASVVQGGTQQFTATVTGAANTAVTWSVTAGGGSITTSGLYTAPATAGTYTVTATSVASTSKKATASVTVAAGPTITAFTAAKSPITAGTSTTLAGTFSGGSGSVDNGVGAVTSGSAVAVTPAATTTYTLTVTAAGGSSTARTATVSVVPVPTQPVITGPALVTASQAGYTASVATQAGSTYAWTISSPGSITAGSTTNQITFTPKPVVVGSLGAGRYWHTATLLPNGKVLVTGGIDSNGAGLASAELFDPGTKTFSSVAQAMATARYGHTATLLPNGKVLIVGGTAAELFDPAAGTFSPTSGAMAVERWYHTATLLPNGKVLLAGGYGAGDYLASAELYDPATGSFTLTPGALTTTARAYHTATLLTNGKVLLAGGYGGTDYLASVELFDPATGTFSAGPSMAAPRNWHSATRLADGKVLLAGGWGATSTPWPTAELFDPAAGTLTVLPHPMNTPRGEHTDTLLANGKVLLAGGYGVEGNLASAELFDPATGTFTAVVGSLRSAKSIPSATLLASGQVLVAGGYDEPNGVGLAVTTTDLFDPAAACFSAVTLTCTVTNAAGTASTPGTLFLAAVPAPATPVLTVPPGLISGGHSYTASVPAQAACTYAWTISNGTITAGQGTRSLAFDAGTAAAPLGLTCTVTNVAGTGKSATANLTLQPAFVSLTPAAATVAPGGQQVYTANQPVTWRLVEGGSLTTTSTQATFKATSGGTNLGVGTYRLVATSKADTNLTATAALTVTVAGAPVISAFTASPATVHAGQSTTLSWSTANATRLTIDWLGDVTGTTSRVVTPMQETTYALEAWGDLGVVRAWVTVKVDQVPAISTFTAAAAILPPGGSTQLTATFSNGTGRIDPGVGPVQSGVPVTEAPGALTDYTLTVSNGYGATTTALVRVNVTGPGAFTPLPSMSQSKAGATSTPLRDGRVALIGGFASNSRVSELFLPASGTFETGPALVDPRKDHTATLCANGDVFIWGGVDASFQGHAYLTSYGRFKPAQGTLTEASLGGIAGYPNSYVLRSGHTATLLADGRILIAGGLSLRDGLSYSGWSGDQLSVGTALLVSPESMAHDYPTAEVTGPLGTTRMDHVAIRLLDGRVLVAGGINRTGAAGTSTYVETPLASAELFDPATGTWSPAGNLADPAHARNPLLLPDGQVLFDGFERFDPATLTFTVLPLPHTGFGGFGYAHAPLSDGRVLLGSLPRENAVSLYDLALGTCFGIANPPVIPGLAFLHLTPLQDGTVLCAGRFDGSGNSGPESYRFEPQSPLSLGLSPGHTNAGIPTAMLASGTEAQGLTWSASGGTVDANGVFLASSPGTYVVTATASNGRKASRLIEVHPAIQIAFGPVPASSTTGVPIPIPVRVLNTPDPRVTWVVQEGAAAGTVTSAGVFTASATGIWHVVATSVADPTRSAMVALRIANGPLAVGITPSTAVVNTGATQTFTATVTNFLSTPNVTWSVQEGASGGTVDGSGLYTAPSSSGTFHVQATSVENPSQSATATVTVANPVSISITPTAASVYAGQPVTFGYTLQAPTTRVVWSATAGSITQGGAFTAPMAAGECTVTVTSVDDPMKSASAVVTVIPPDVTLGLRPTYANLTPGACRTFTATLQVTGSTDNGILWSCSGGLLVPKGASAFYAAPLVPGSYSVTATSSANPEVSLSATVVVSAQAPSTPFLNVIPSAATLGVGQRLFLGSEYTVADPQSGLDWSTDGGALAIESSGASAFLTAPASPGTVTVTLAGRGAHAGLTAHASISVVAAPPVPIAVLPSAATLNVYQTMLLEAVDAAGVPIPDAVWSVQEANGGWVSAAGMYEAPGQAGTYHVTAGLPGAPSTTATATITVVSGGGGGGDGDPVPTDRGVTVSPDRAQIPAGTYQAFAAVVAGLDDQRVTWRLETATPDASVGNDGVFTANRPGTYRVVAASTVDPSLNGSSVVTVVSSVTPIANLPANLPLRGYSVTALQDGRILMVGGYDASGVAVGTGRVYDPATGSFTEVSNTLVGKAYHSAQLLDDGRVLLSGGMAPTIYPGGVSSGIDYQWRQAVLYDPGTNSFQSPPVPTNTTYPNPAAGQMRGSHPTGTAVKLGDGKILVVGDNYPVGDYNGHLITAVQRYRRSEIFDPATGTFDLSNWNSAMTADPWAPTPNCFETLPGQTAVTLDDGRALITGGHIPPVADSVDPCTGAVKTPYGETAGSYPYSACIKADAKIFGGGVLNTVGPMTIPRTYHTMTKLPDGRVLIVGGNQSVSFDATPQNRDPVSGIFDPHAKYTSTATAEIFDPATGTFTLTGSLSEARAMHAAILLPTGKVLIVGGTQEFGDGRYTWPNSIELFDPESGTFSVLDYLDYGLSRPSLVLLNTGDVFMAGQIQAPMDPPAIPRYMKWDAKAEVFRSSVSGLPFLVGSTLLGLAATAPNPEVEFVTINQGVERYIGFELDSKQTEFSNIVDDKKLPLTWRRKIKILANRSSILKIYFNSNEKVVADVLFSISQNSITYITQNIEKYEFKPKNNNFGSTSPGHEIILNNTLFPFLKSGENQFKIEIIQQGKTVFTKQFTVNVEYRKAFQVDLIPVRYLSSTNRYDAAYNSMMSAMNDLKQRLDWSLKAMFPISIPEGDVSIVNVNPHNINYEWDDQLPGYGSLVSLWSNAPTTIEQSYTRWSQILPDFVSKPSIAAIYNDAWLLDNVIVLVVPNIEGKTFLTGKITAGRTTLGSHVSAILNFDTSGTILTNSTDPMNAAHEIGHGFGLLHAPYPPGLASVDPNWPNLSQYKYGQIGYINFDSRYVRDGFFNKYLSGSTRDLMSDDYRLKFIRGISDYNFQQLMELITIR